jgi:AcrR family transcriptional regulator
MTNNEILDASFRVWGKTFYMSTSLTDVASELGVSKTALYRHFKNKGLLLRAMSEVFFDRFADFLHPVYDKCLLEDDFGERGLKMTRALASYYSCNKYDFIWYITNIHGSTEPCFNFKEQLRLRNIDLEALKASDDGSYPSGNQLIFGTMFYMVAHFLKFSLDPSAGVVDFFVDTVEAKIRTGLNIGASEIDLLDYDSLESCIESSVGGGGDDDESHNKLLRSVAEAVAKAGPWKVSMQMVAERSGLSKSSLYSHFASREAMLKELFIKELDIMASYVEKCSLSSTLPLEQLYLALFGISNFLTKKRSDILLILDALKTRRPVFKKKDCEEEMPFSCVYKVFSQIKNKDGSDLINKGDTEWILFMVINMLQRRPNGMNFSDITNKSIRILFRFIAGGTEARSKK